MKPEEGDRDPSGFWKSKGSMGSTFLYIDCPEAKGVFVGVDRRDSFATVQLTFGSTAVRQRVPASDWARLCRAVLAEIGTPEERKRYAKETP